MSAASPPPRHPTLPVLLFDKAMGAKWRLPPCPRVWCWITGKMEEGKRIPCLLHSHLPLGGGQRWSIPSLCGKCLEMSLELRLARRGLIRQPLRATAATAAQSIIGGGREGGRGDVEPCTRLSASFFICLYLVWVHTVLTLLLPPQRRLRGPLQAARVNL